MDTRSWKTCPCPNKKTFHKNVFVILDIVDIVYVSVIINIFSKTFNKYEDS